MHHTDRVKPLAGLHRPPRCKVTGFTCLLVAWQGERTRRRKVGIDPVAYVLSINLHRRHLTASQRAMIGAAVKEIYEREAKERQKMAGQQYHKGSAKVVAHVPQPSGDEPEAEDRESQERESSGKKSRDAAGEAVDVGGRIII